LLGRKRVKINFKFFCFKNKNSKGQIGDGTYIQRALPTKIDETGSLANKRIKSLSAGGFFSCVIAIDDLVYCWGANEYKK
jgi:alpha-tubulin suppressor-like RCC1 family protein